MPHGMYKFNFSQRSSRGLTGMAAIVSLGLSLCLTTAGRAQEKRPDPQPSPTPVSGADSNSNSVKRSRHAEVPTASSAAVANNPTTRDHAVDLRSQINSAITPAERAQAERALIDYLVSSNRRPEALAELRSMLRKDQFDPQYYYNVGNGLARLDDAAGAADAYRKAISQRNGHYSRALNNLGVVLIRMGRLDEAQEALTAAATQENSQYAEASFNLGRVYALKGDTELAMNEWKRAVWLQPGDADAVAALARGYASQGNPRAALELLDGFVTRSTRKGVTAPQVILEARNEITRDSSEPTQTRVDNKISQKTPAQPKQNQAATGAMSLSFSAPPAGRPPSIGQESFDLLQSARKAHSEGHEEAAVSLYRRLLEREGGYFGPANLEMAYPLITLGKQNEALATLAVVTRRDPARYPVAFYYLGRIYEQSGRLDLAAPNFERAASLYGEGNPQVLVDLSRVREKQGDAAGALSAFESYVKSMARSSSVPDWAVQHLAALRQAALSERASKTAAK